MGGKDSPAAVDYLIWPWFERLDAIKILAPGKYQNKTFFEVLHAIRTKTKACCDL